MAKPKYQPLAERFESFEERKSHTIEHSGRDWEFFSLSSSVLFTARNAARPLLRSLSQMFGDKSGDKAASWSSIKNPDVLEVDVPGEDGELRSQRTVFNMEKTESTNEAVSLNVISYRDNARTTAVEDLVQAVTDPETKTLIGRIVLDSLREDFPEIRGKELNGREKDEYAREFMNDPDNDLEFMKAMLTGVAKANEKLLGPFADVVGALSKKIKGQVLAEATTDEGNESKDAPEGTDEEE